jgi:hypothetical protein
MATACTHVEQVLVTDPGDDRGALHEHPRIPPPPLGG